MNAWRAIAPSSRGRSRSCSASQLEQSQCLLNLAHRTISTSLTKNTSKAVDTTVRAETKSTIMPALVQVVRESFDADVKAGVQDSLQKVRSPGPP
jgi:hypothetical protein